MLGRLLGLEKKTASHQRVSSYRNRVCKGPKAGVIFEIVGEWVGLGAGYISLWAKIRAPLLIWSETF